MKITLFVILTALLVGCASPHNTSSAVYYHDQMISPNKSEISSVLASADIRVFGEYVDDGEVEPGSMMYSGAAGIIGIAAQLAAQSATIGDQRDRELSAKQIQANKILEPFADEIATLNISTFLKKGQDYQLVGSADEATQRYILNGSPVFYVAQDLNSVRLEIVFKLFDGRSSDQLLYENKVEVIDVAGGARNVGFYLNIANIKSKLSKLYQRSVDIVLKDAYSSLKSSTGKIENFKIYTNTDFRFERGELITARCGVQLVRNLRGWLISYNDIKKNNPCTDPAQASL